MAEQIFCRPVNLPLQSNTGLTLEKLLAAKKLLDANHPVPEPIFYYTSFRQLRRLGLSPLMIQERLRSGLLIKCNMLPER